MEKDFRASTQTLVGQGGSDSPAPRRAERKKNSNMYIIEAFIKRDYPEDAEIRIKKMREEMKQVVDTKFSPDMPPEPLAPSFYKGESLAETDHPVPYDTVFQKIVNLLAIGFFEIDEPSSKKDPEQIMAYFRVEIAKL